MVEVIVLVVLALIQMLAEDDETVTSLEEAITADGEYTFSDLGMAMGTLGSELGDSLPDIVKTVGTVTAAKETGALSVIGVNPSDNGSLISTVTNWLKNPWVWAGAAVLTGLFLFSQARRS